MNSCQCECLFSPLCVQVKRSAPAKVFSVRRTFKFHLGLGPLTLKFDRATLPFLKNDMQHEAYRHRKNISDKTWAIS